jgi:hypothetical protein
MKNLATLIIFTTFSTTPVFADIFGTSKIDCETQILKAISLWGKSAVTACKQAIQQGDLYFTVVDSSTSPPGQIKVWKSKSKPERIVISHSSPLKEKESKSPILKVDTEVRLDPENNCGLSSASLLDSKVIISGSGCYEFSEQSRKLDSAYDDDYDHSKSNNAIMLNHIKKYYKKAKITLSDEQAQKIRNNCRNSAVIGQLSLDSEGRSDLNYSEYLHRLENAPEPMEAK